MFSYPHVRWKLQLEVVGLFALKALALLYADYTGNFGPSYNMQAQDHCSCLQAAEANCFGAQIALTCNNH